MGRTSYLGGLVAAVLGLVAVLAVGPLARPESSTASSQEGNAGQPVVFEARIFYPPTTPAIHVVPAYEVPDGKRLVVEHVSGSVILGSQTRLRIRVHGHFLPFQLDPHASVSSIQRATASEPMTFVVDDVGPNRQELRVELLREGSSLPFIVNHLLFFSGHLYEKQPLG